jgi:CRP/FNR family transcriptional regulator
MKTSRQLSNMEITGAGQRPGKGFLSNFSDADLNGFDSIKVSKAYPKGTMLFVEGQPSAAVFMLVEGRVKLSTCSREGKIIILEIVEPGDVLGLSAALNGVDYETTAETLELCRVNYIKTDDLLRYLQANPAACFDAARQLSRNYQTAYRQVRSLALSDSVVDKLARLFLDWIGTKHNGDQSVRLKHSYTHEDMAEMIGTTRETVTRALKYFRERDLITANATELVIHDRQRLLATIGSRRGLRSVT